jgi:hypothetical protein
MASDVSEWEYDLDMAELRELMDMVWLVEEIPMAKIQDLCEDHVIEHYKFASLWNKLLDESHKVMARIEERMEAIPGSEV